LHGRATASDGSLQRTTLLFCLVCTYKPSFCWLFFEKTKRHPGFNSRISTRQAGSRMWTGGRAHARRTWYEYESTSSHQQLRPLSPNTPLTASLHRATNPKTPPPSVSKASCLRPTAATFSRTSAAVSHAAAGSARDPLS
jgi:hypothetical protein